MHRRTFLQLSIVTAVIAPWLSGCTTEVRAKGSMATPQVLGTMCSHEELMAIGKSYCEMHTNECDQSSLEKLLLADADGKPFTTTETSALEKFLFQKITTEFVHNDLAIVKGWVLSRTEARQIALYALLS